MMRHKRKMYFITIPAGRCGSTYLAGLLASTKMLGFPEEYLNNKSINGKIDDFFDKIWKTNLPPNILITPGGTNCRKHDELGKILGVKAAIDDVIDAVPQIKTYSIQYIYLWRDNSLRQAISTYRAMESAVWAITEKTKLATLITRKLPFDKNRIFNHLRQVLILEAKTNLFFSDKPHFALTYEELVANPTKTVQRVAEFLNVKIPKDFIPTSPLLIQADDISEDWYVRMGGKDCIEKARKSLN